MRNNFHTNPISFKIYIFLKSNSDDVFKANYFNITSILGVDFSIYYLAGKGSKIKTVESVTFSDLGGVIFSLLKNPL